MFLNSHPNYFFTKDGTRIFYVSNFNPKEYDPSRPLIVFCYGLLCNFAHYKYQIPYFEERDYQILMHDYRGHFSSSQSEIATCTFDNFANDLAELLSSLGALDNVHLVGHSMGVNVVLEVARKFPELSSSLTLISGAVVPPQDVMFDSNIMDLAFPLIEKVKHAQPKFFSYFWKNAYKNPLAQVFIWDGGFNKKQVSLKYIQTYMKKISELPEEMFFHLLKIMHDHDIIVDLEKIQIPTLIIGGDKDKIIPNYLQLMLHKYLKNSELYIVKDGSHVPQADFPETINERIDRFIARLN